MVSVRRVAPILLLAAAVPVFAAKRPANTSRPPRELHRVGTHYTAYNPPDPASYPPGSKTYEIKQGDTLWALAKQFYGNPYLWPQLWESNTWITDAHWIYAGDTLLVEGETAAAAGTASTEQVAQTTAPLVSTGTDQPTGAAVTAEVAPTSPPIPLGTEADIYCFGYIGSDKEPLPNRVGSFEDVETRYVPEATNQPLGGSDIDLMYIDGGTSTGLVAGETYMVVSKQELVHHPRTNEVLGRQYAYRGQVKILCADDRHARGVIVQSCMPIRIGDYLKPVPQLPIPLARIPQMPGFCDPPSGKTSGFIVRGDVGAAWAIGEGQLVEVNLGHEDQVQPGDFFTVFRDSPQAGQPRQILGEIGILTTEAHTATAKVMQMRYTMQIGDRIELK